MKNKIIEIFKNKNIAILGFGKEGKSSYNFLRNNLKNEKITIIDQNTELNKHDDLFINDKNIDFVLGSEYLENLNKYDIIIKSPGIKIPESKVDLNKVTSQIEIILEIDRKNIIGITGTKGKSTTSSLLYKVLKDQNKDCLLLGNVGNPIFDYIDQINEHTILIIEMSSYQLDLVHLSPHISVLLNLFEDHLNYHKTIEAYHLAKLNIFKYQTTDDYSLYTSTCENTKKYITKTNYNSNIIDINNEFTIKNDNIYYKNIRVYDTKTERLLLGKHNLSNILFVIYIAMLLKLDLNKCTKTINTFKPLEHRMEQVGTFNNITYYNDSIATIPEATINCLEAYKDVDTLIFGGQDRGIDYQILIDYLNNSNVNNFICMKDTGYKLAPYIKKGKVYKAETLEDAVDIAKKVTKTACLLSPAAPSYNAFKNFEEKGNKYKELVKK